MVIKLVMDLFSFLNSNRHPREVAAAVSFAFILLLIPGGNLLWIFLFSLSFFLKINTALELTLLALLKPLTPLLDPLLHETGKTFLTIPFLRPFFTRIYNLPLVPYTRFNNTVVAGGLVTGLLLFIPIYLLMTYLITKYRKQVTERIASSRIYKSLMRFPLVAKLLLLAGKKR